MMLFYECQFGTPCPLNLEVTYGPKVEIECLEFCDQLPLDWRLVTDACEQITEWHPGQCPGRNDYLKGLWDMQRPARHRPGTEGTPAARAVIETRGIGVARVIVHLRDRTYRTAVLPVLAEGCE